MAAGSIPHYLEYEIRGHVRENRAAGVITACDMSSAAPEEVLTDRCPDDGAVPVTNALIDLVVDNNIFH